MDRRGRTSRPLSRAEARDRYRQQRLSQEPTWRGATYRALIAAGIFFAVVVILGQNPAAAAALAIFMLAFYIPLGYWMDRFFYNRRRRQGG